MASFQDIRSRHPRPMTFLSLAPTTSETSPVSQSSQQQQQQHQPFVRRSSSQSSAGSANGLRFLKLGPVQNGEDLDEKAEVAVE